MTNTFTSYDRASAHYTSDKLNTLSRLNNACSWACHQNTDHCKKNHVKLVNNYYEYTDPIYFGIINLMNVKGSYALMNVIILAFILPLVMLLLLIRIIDLQIKIRQLKNKNGLN